MSYEIYSDESGSGEDRYEAIGTISIKSENVNSIRDGLNKILREYNLEYCEYKKVRDERRYLCTIKMLDFTVSKVLSEDIKLMVLVWDKYDSRHTIRRRDDQKNISIMYYHALKNTKRMWFNTGLVSSFYPDELTKVDFKNIIQYIKNGRIKKIPTVIKTLFGDEFQKLFPVIKDHKEIISKDDVLIQIIDLITGIVRLSYEEYNIFSQWQESQNNQIQDNIFGEMYWQPFTITKSKEYKYKLIQAINNLFKDK